MMRLAIIGLGNIGSAVLEHLLRKPLPGIRPVALCDIREPSPPVAEIIKTAGLPLFQDAAQLALNAPDIVLEAAGAEAAARYAAFFLEKGISFITVSAGGLLEPELWQRLASLCRPEGPRLIIPSGAIGGLDLIRAASLGKLERVHLRTTKPASSLATDVESSRAKAAEKKVLYSGPAAGAVKLYPKNINVAAAISLAGVGAEKTTVEIIADPQSAENIHQISLEGEFGNAEITIRNRPSTANPRTSRLAIMSVLAALARLGSGVRVGD